MSARATLSLGVIFTLLGTAFTVSPEFLEHSPVGFEQRGVIHHTFHYLILLGGFTLVTGVLFRDRLLETVGLWGCVLPVALNLTALLTAGDLRDESGVDIALRLVVIFALADRLLELRNEDR